MPHFRRLEPIRFPNQPHCSVGVLERVSPRIVSYDLTSKPVASQADSTAEQQVRAAVWAFTDGTSKERSVAVTDLDGDGRLDLLATDAKDNTIAFYRQAPQIGLGAAEQFSAF